MSVWIRSHNDGEIICNERLPVFTYNHPHFESLNKKLMKEMGDSGIEFLFPEQIHNLDGSSTNVKALQTYNSIETPSLSLIKQWAMDLVRGYGGFNYNVPQCWVALYNKGDYTKSHGHFPASFAFVYFVKSPKGSSPLVFSTSGKRVTPNEGKLVLFHGSLRHKVPKNRCNGRIVVAGNLYLNDAF